MSMKRYTNEKIVHRLRAAQVIIERWRVPYNILRPHSAPGNMHLAPETCLAIQEIRLAEKAAKTFGLD